MKLSGAEYLRVSQLRDAASLPQFASSAEGRQESVVSAMESEDMQIVNAAFMRDSDVREDVVASLRERIESGSYEVSGQQIAEMMVRRLLADRMR